MAVRYHGCTCHLRYSALKKSSSDQANNTSNNELNNKNENKSNAKEDR